jgi:hypothetical protein
MIKREGFKFAAKKVKIKIKQMQALKLLWRFDLEYLWKISLCHAIVKGAVVDSLVFVRKEERTICSNP